MVPLVVWRTEIVDKYTDERVILREKVSIRGRMRWVWMSSAVRCEWTHLGLRSALECDGETPLDHGVKWLFVLALGSLLPDTWKECCDGGGGGGMVRR